ncbi:nuclear transport factor 2 family protein [Mycobacterium sp. AZCC_0083]|uniref:nuclear transport factor 2 family protein n=1 Tax=Mycobacterium sp. AZCC_0083 TaxID=2735882 RepID=UPI00161394CE|nr:nuclear transport factor 2 family protein [Mycobacterium sp. AZCC_0083]MBB5160565.1 ketosteroid isomerase-like protein [Mycobacterium sp. AZCC_0083]
MPEGARMDAAANLKLIQDLYDAYISGDLQAIMRPFNDQSVWIELGDTQRAGVFRGATGLLEHAMRNQELTDGSLTTEVQEIVGGEKYVVVVERATAQRKGRALDMLCATSYQMANGVVAEMRVLPFDSREWQQFWE